MKRKPDPLLVLAAIVIVGIFTTSLFQGKETHKVDETQFVAVAQG